MKVLVSRREIQPVTARRQGEYYGPSGIRTQDLRIMSPLL
jgi:hypothetical protein